MNRKKIFFWSFSVISAISTVILFVSIIVDINKDTQNTNVSFNEIKIMTDEDKIIHRPRFQVEVYKKDFNYLIASDGLLNEETGDGYLNNVNLDSSFGRVDSKKIVIDMEKEIIEFEDRPVFLIYSID